MPHNWNINTRLIHWALLITVIFQQFSSIWMSDHGTQFLFPYHRIIGAIASVVVLLFWLNSYALYHFEILFPWGKQARGEVLRELAGLLKRKATCEREPNWTLQLYPRARHPRAVRLRDYGHDYVFDDLPCYIS